MDVRTCRKCGRMYNHITGPTMCQPCKDALEEKFVEVKTYIRDNKNAPIQQVADETDVSVKQLKQWVREERLSFSEESGVALDCENCGATIRTGRFCEKCKVALGKSFDSLMERRGLENKPEPKRDGNRMRSIKF